MKIRDIALRMVIGIFIVSILAAIVVATIAYLPYVLVAIVVIAYVAMIIFFGYVLGDGIIYLIKDARSKE